MPLQTTLKPMPKIKAANTIGAKGIGMLMPMMDKTSKATTIVIAKRRKINLLSPNGSFNFINNEV